MPFFNSGSISHGSGPQLLRVWIDQYGRLPKENKKEKTHEHKMATQLSASTAKGKKIPPELVGCTIFEDAHARRQIEESRMEKSARLLNELASLDSEPLKPINEPLYKKWVRIKQGNTSVPENHPLRNIPWTGGEEGWKLIDEKNKAVKRKMAEDSIERKRQRIEAKLTQ